MSRREASFVSNVLQATKTNIDHAWAAIENRVSTKYLREFRGKIGTFEQRPRGFRSCKWHCKNQERSSIVTIRNRSSINVWNGTRKAPLRAIWDEAWKEAIWGRGAKRRKTGSEFHGRKKDRGGERTPGMGNYAFCWISFVARRHLDGLNIRKKHFPRIKSSRNVLFAIGVSRLETVPLRKRFKRLEDSRGKG